jgi:hypothetical protein
MGVNAFKVLAGSVAAAGGGGLCRIEEDGSIGCACTLAELGFCGFVQEDCWPARRIDSGDKLGEVVLQPMDWPLSEIAQAEAGGV